MTPTARRETHAAMVRFADGDRLAFRQVFDALWPALLTLTTRALASRADAEDAAQRALLKVFDRIVDLDREHDGVAWAVTICGYEILTMRRQIHRRREDDAAIEPADGRPPADAVLVDVELRSAVHAAIALLPHRDREAIAGVLLGEPPTGETERKRRFRAIERLRAAWRKAHG
jgi:RNA polymerase sigma factor (sigma-70 family)